MHTYMYGITISEKKSPKFEEEMGNRRESLEGSKGKEGKEKKGKEKEGKRRGKCNRDLKNIIKSV